MPVALARRFRVQVSTDNATWINVGGVTDLNYQVTNNTQPADDYDYSGFNGIEKTNISWTVTVRALRRYSAGYVFDAGQELARAAQLQFGDAARIYIRWFDRNGGAEAFSGRGIVQYTPAQTGVDDLDAVTITITGDGVLAAITNPYSAGTAAPVVTNVTPAGRAAGQAVLISGTGFTNASAVTFAGTAATSYSVQNDQAITAVLPTGTAGAASVVVTTPNGSSAGYTYTRA